MPTLNQYVSSSKKSGYYIRASVGASYPVTLQVTALATRILQEAEYKDGDTVPTKLVWSLFDIGLLYTQSTHNIPEEKGDILGAFEDANISAKLDAETKNRLIEFLDAYEGQAKEKILQLKADLEGYESTVDSTTEKRPLSRGKRFNTPYPNDKDELLSLLFSWSKVSSPPEFRRLRQRVNRQSVTLLKSFQSFYYHPLLIPEAKITASSSVKYKLNTAEWGTIIVEDCRHLINARNYGEELDFRISFPGINDGDKMTHVVDGVIQGKDIGKLEEEILIADVLSHIESVEPPSVEAVESELDKICDFVDVNEYSEYVIRDEFNDFGQGSIDVPYELLRKLKDVEDVQIQPMESFPSAGEDGEIFIGKVDRISNSGNPIVELDSGGHTLLPGGEEGEYYFIFKKSRTHRSRPLGKITIDM